MTRAQIIYWRDVPVQVRAHDGRARLSRPLSPRFQQTVHRAAYRAGAINGWDYIQEWRPSAWQEYGGAVEDVLAELAAELEAAYDGGAPAPPSRAVGSGSGRSVKRSRAKGTAVPGFTLL